MSSFSYSLIRSRRRTLALQVNRKGELIVRAPLKMHVDFIEDFIMQKKDWITKHQTKIQESPMKHEKISYAESEITAMKGRLLEYIIPRTQELWGTTKLPKYTSIKITKSEHRWGSCSGKNGLCFSYRLAEYLDINTKFIDAIVVHELAHLREKNHQKPFWNLVYHMMPEYETNITEGKMNPIY